MSDWTATGGHVPHAARLHTGPRIGALPIYNEPASWSAPHPAGRVLALGTESEHVNRLRWLNGGEWWVTRAQLNVVGDVCATHVLLDRLVPDLRLANGAEWLDDVVAAVLRSALPRPAASYDAEVLPRDQHAVGVLAWEAPAIVLASALERTLKASREEARGIAEGFVEATLSASGRRRFLGAAYFAAAVDSGKRLPEAHEAGVADVVTGIVEELDAAVSTESPDPRALLSEPVRGRAAVLKNFAVSPVTQEEERWLEARLTGDIAVRAWGEHVDRPGESVLWYRDATPVIAGRLTGDQLKRVLAAIVIASDAGVPATNVLGALSERSLTHEADVAGAVEDIRRLAGGTAS